MKREKAAAALVTLAESLGDDTIGSLWYLFGSINRDEMVVNDIDLLILCRDDYQADRLRSAIDVDMLGLPVDLSLMTYQEAYEIDVINLQLGSKIFPTIEVIGSSAYIG